MPWNPRKPLKIRDKFFTRKKKDFKSNLFFSNFISTTSNVIFKKELINHIGYFRNLRFAHDWDFFLRASFHGKLKLVPKALISYRIHNSNTISSNKKMMTLEICIIYAYYMRKFSIESPLAKNLLFLEDYFNYYNLQENYELILALVLLFNSRTKKGASGTYKDLLSNKELLEYFLHKVII